MRRHEGLKSEAQRPSAETSGIPGDGMFSFLAANESGGAL